MIRINLLPVRAAKKQELGQKQLILFALVVVGGMGSNPGVVVGAIFLIGLPELFREFAEYRFLIYGIALIAMMLYRPEGLLPSKVTRRELYAAEELAAVAEGDVSSAPPAASQGVGR